MERHGTASATAISFAMTVRKMARIYTIYRDGAAMN